MSLRDEEIAKNERILRNKRIAFLIIMALFLALGIYSKIDGEKSKDSLLKHYSMTIGQITGFYRNGRGDADAITYEYYINKKKYTDGRPFYPKDHLGDVFVGRYFPLIYDNTNFDNEHLLIWRDDFIYYELAVPDSLYWVRAYSREQ